MTDENHDNMKRELLKQLFNAERVLEDVNPALPKKNIASFEENKAMLAGAFRMGAEAKYMQFSSYVNAGFTEEQALFLVSK